MPSADDDAALKFVAASEYGFPDSLSELVFGDPELMAATRIDLTQRNLTELRPPYLKVVREPEIVAYVGGCPAPTLSQLRLAATFHLNRSGFYREHPEVEEWSRLAARLLVRGGPNDYQMTHLWVAPHRRGQGLGASLMLERMEQARREGFARVVMEATARNPAVRIYERIGYERLREVSIVHPVSGKNITYVHLSFDFRANTNFSLQTPRP